MKVAIVGMGLIGGSFYKAALRAGHEVTALHHGDKTGFENAELILVCLPPDVIVSWVREHADSFAKGAVVIDIAGTKRGIMTEMNNVEQHGWTFIGGHPMAGREVSGFENSLADLFSGASMILVPRSGCDQSAEIERVKPFFKSVGFGQVKVTTPEKHDEMIAFTSQLCHVIATAYSRDELVPETPGYSAGSYADMTRIATQNPQIWSELFLGNRDSLMPVIGRFVDRLNEVKDVLARQDRARLEEIINEGAKGKWT